MYHCVITDSNLCPTPIISVSITEPLQDSSIYNNVSCYGLNDADISLLLSGGTPHNVTWSSLLGYTNNGVNILNLYADIYTATITDINKGPLYETAAFQNLQRLLFMVYLQMLLFGNDDGSIDLTTNNRNHLNWTGPNGFNSNFEDIDSLSPGIYIVSTDINGCIGPSLTFVISNPQIF